MKVREPSRRRAESSEDWESETSGATQPSWLTDVGTLSFEKLDRDAQTEVVVVGGGITGITTAYLLSKVGTKVIVLEDGKVGSGETGRTTAHVTNALDDRYYNIKRLHGKDKARLAAASHTAAIDKIESIVRAENIDCDFERLDGYLILDPTDRKKSLESELESTQDAGIATESLDCAPSMPFETGPCIRFRKQAQFHPLKYLEGLAHAVLRHDGAIFTGTHVQAVSSEGVKTADGRRVHARSVVVATNAPIVDRVSKVYLMQDAFRTYAIAARVRKGAVPKGLYWDTGNQESKNVVPPYHYVRIQELKDDSEWDLLIVGGEDHGTGNAVGLENRFRILEDWARERFPIGDISYRWSGQVMEPRDSLAFIGRNPRDKRKNLFIATGDSGNGMTHGTIAGILLRDLILENENEWFSLYNPSRRVRGHESAPYGGQPKLYKMATDSAFREAAKLPAGRGMVAEIRRENDPLAFYRDSDGTLHSYSALCPHLGCIVRWNEVEKSFDCPCHGSRFSYSGRVINGPADRDLRHKRKKATVD